MASKKPSTPLQVGEGYSAANLPPIRVDGKTGEVISDAPLSPSDKPKRVFSPRKLLSSGGLLSPTAGSADDGKQQERGDMPMYNPPPKEEGGKDKGKEPSRVNSPRSSFAKLDALSPNNSRRMAEADAALRRAAIEEQRTGVYFPGKLSRLGEQLPSVSEDAAAGASPLPPASSLHDSDKVPMKAFRGPELDDARGKDSAKDIVAFYHDGIRTELRDLYAFLESWEKANWRSDGRRVERFFTWWDVFKGAVYEWFNVDERVFITHMETFQASLMEFDGTRRANKRLDFILAAQAVDALREDLMGSGSPETMDNFVVNIQKCFPALLSYLLLKEEMMSFQIHVARNSGVLQDKHINNMAEVMARETLKVSFGSYLLCMYLAPLSEAERQAWVKEKLPFMQARKFPGMWTQYTNHRLVMKA